jgi:hypothetical protein
MKKTAGSVLAVLLAVYVLLLIPESKPRPVASADRTPFAWNRDEYWRTLENRYRVARETGNSELQARVASGLERFALLNDSVQTCTYEAGDPIFDRVESVLFELSPDIAACQVRFADYLDSFNDLRRSLKKQSCRWDLNDAVVRHRLYRLLYGGRTAVEQIMLQVPPDSIPALTVVENVPSRTPSASVFGVTIHSGDVLVSRGGAPTSALIARGNDYPGNFSHVALVHVDPQTSRVSIIEAHIEVGVAIATQEQYLNDTKLRVMVLRLRPDLPALQADPMLPHKAACLSLQRAQREHIPYDFEMDFQNPKELFCSEVASDAYRQVGITLWMGLSHISSTGIMAWLAAFGVTHFETQEPSDLEYDPQLRVVAEWRDPETLFKDQVDNAVVDVMLEGAENGENLRYVWYRLPLARIAKAYSAALNAFGKIGPVPEGMSATAGLRNQWFSATHARIKARVIVEADQFKLQNGYIPPYWELVRMARKAKRELL